MGEPVPVTQGSGRVVRCVRGGVAAQNGVRAFTSQPGTTQRGLGTLLRGTCAGLGGLEAALGGRQQFGIGIAREALVQRILLGVQRGLVAIAGGSRVVEQLLVGVPALLDGMHGRLPLLCCSRSATAWLRLAEIGDHLIA